MTLAMRELLQLLQHENCYNYYNVSSAVMGDANMTNIALQLTKFIFLLFLLRVEPNYKSLRGRGLYMRKKECLYAKKKK